MTSCTGAGAPDGRYERDGDELMRDRAGRAAVAAQEGQAVGRHERRQHQASRSDRAARAGITLVGPVRGTQVGRTMQPAKAGPARAPHKAAGATRSRQAGAGARAGRIAMWAGRVARAAEQAQVWWAEGTERVAARARERWNEQASTQRTTARQPTAAASPSRRQRAVPGRRRPRHPPVRDLRPLRRRPRRGAAVPERRRRRISRADPPRRGILPPRGGGRAGGRTW